MSKVNLEVIKPWITRRVNEILGFEDDVVVEFVFNQLEEKVSIFFPFPFSLFCFFFFTGICGRLFGEKCGGKMPQKSDINVKET